MFLPFEQRHLKLELPVKVVFDDPFVAAGHENEVFDSGLAGLVNDMLNKRPIDDRQHFLRHSLSGRQEPGAEAGYGEDGFADRVHAIKMCIGINGYSEEYTFSFKLLSNPASKGQIQSEQLEPDSSCLPVLKLIAHRMPVVANRPAGSKENSSIVIRRILAGRRFGRGLRPYTRGFCLMTIPKRIFSGVTAALLAFGAADLAWAQQDNNWLTAPVSTALCQRCSRLL